GAHHGGGSLLGGAFGSGAAGGAAGGGSPATRAHRRDAALPSGAADAVPLAGDVTRVVTSIPAWTWLALAALALLAAGGALASAVLARRARRTGATAAALRRRAITDPLTGVLNRRGWDERIVGEIARAQ